MRSQKAIILIFTCFLSIGIKAQSFEFKNFYAKGDHPNTSESIMLLKPQETLRFNLPYAIEAEQESSLLAINGLDLPLPEQRFNLNFLLVDPCWYSGNANMNLNLIRNGYDPYYHNSQYIPSFTETMVCTLAKSVVSRFIR